MCSEKAADVLDGMRKAEWRPVGANAEGAAAAAAGEDAAAAAGDAWPWPRFCLLCESGGESAADDAAAAAAAACCCFFLNPSDEKTDLLVSPSHEVNWLQRGDWAAEGAEDAAAAAAAAAAAEERVEVPNVGEDA